MATSIIKLGEYYMLYSSIVDAPKTFGMDLKTFRDYYQFEYGASGMQMLDSRLERVEEKGTSSTTYDSVFEQLMLNHAGPGENFLTIDEIRRAYCLREAIIDGWRIDDGGEWINEKNGDAE